MGGGLCWIFDVEAWLDFSSRGSAAALSRRTERTSWLPGDTSRLRPGLLRPRDTSRDRPSLCGDFDRHEGGGDLGRSSLRGEKRLGGDRRLVYGAGP